MRKKEYHDPDHEDPDTAQADYYEDIPEVPLDMDPHYYSYSDIILCYVTTSMCVYLLSIFIHFVYITYMVIFFHIQDLPFLAIPVVFIFMKVVGMLACKISGRCLRRDPIPMKKLKCSLLFINFLNFFTCFVSTILIMFVIYCMVMDFMGHQSGFQDQVRYLFFILIGIFLISLPSFVLIYMFVEAREGFRHLNLKYIKHVEKIEMRRRFAEKARIRGFGLYEFDDERVQGQRGGAGMIAEEVSDEENSDKGSNDSNL